MIPLRDQEILRQRFQNNLANRVRIDYFTQRPSPIYVAGRQDCVYCEEVRVLLEEVASLSPRIALTVHELSEARELATEMAVDRVPAIVVRGQANRPVRFFGIPSGNAFSGFIESLLDAARGGVELKPETVKQLRKLRSDVDVQVFVTPTGTYCPAQARTAHKLALQSPKVKVAVVEASEFPALAQRYGIRAVPTTVINDRIVVPGALDETDLVSLVMKVVEGRPLSLDDARPGPTTPLTAPTQQAMRASAAGGLVLPR